MCDNVNILDKENYYKKRLIFEIIDIFIKRQNYSLSKQSDTDLLSDSYILVLNLLSPL